MDTIFRGSLASAADRRLAWIDALLVDHAVFRFVLPRFSVVAPGRLYRSAHPMPGQLARYARRHGIRTLINLRGPTGNGADALSREAAARLGMAFVDAPFGSREAPLPERVLALAETFRTMAEPGLLHCKSGADRAGVTAGIFLLLQGGTTHDALGQLSWWRHGHLSRSRTGILDAFFLAFRAEAEGRKPFLDWVREDYDRDSLRARFHANGLASFLTDRVLGRE